jgi:carbon-monoxide dehydrogenase small subunit
MTDKKTVAMKVNGKSVTITGYPMARLLDILREEMGLTGTKEGCGEGECGACSVLINGRLVNSCLVPLAQAEGAEVRTIEGIAPQGGLHPVQEAFLGWGGAQCGICTPGMIMATVSLLEKNPAPSDQEIRDGLAGNICRCTGYVKIIDSVRAAAAKTGGQTV